ncbi:MAG TPA: efflux RND transporter periplasmic adaptor subunit [Candidatus Blautia merdigallinarum]|uniref:Efflux RND transporter periplasmic adaptor subunit n=1 Tax=Candidatus Blautia merdigallinarum TaxID=2838495 RepID=A0A9D2N854_9FIRM|nr:efflux RND transporter periplasmic adaptor subunit [Candidatus Blautia merdigallinarum]
MNKKHKIIGGICGAVCIGGLAAGIFIIRGAGDKKAEDLAYVMSVSSMNDMSGTQRLAGVVESQKTLEIQKDSEREIKEILVKAGDNVEVGTPLFTYDTATLETDIQQAKLDLERADSEMSNLKAQIQQLEKEKKNAPEEEQFSYTTQIQSAQMDLKKSEYDRKAKEVEINRIQSQIDNSTVTSEMKGVVKSVQNQGQTVTEMYGDSAGQAFITILATGEYRVKGRVNEQNISEITEGSPAVVRSRVDEKQVWTGTYSAVDTKNPQNNSSSMYYSSGSEDSSQTTSTSYPFYVDLESSQGLLLGQHVYIEHDTGMSQREPGIWLNEAFIADLDKKPYVWAEKNGALEKRTVVLGTYDAEMMQYKIEDGVGNGDYVAYPQEFLEEGMKTTHDPAQAYAGDMESASGEETLQEGEMIQEETTDEILEEEESSPEL